MDAKQQNNASHFQACYAKKRIQINNLLLVYRSQHTVQCSGCKITHAKAFVLSGDKVKQIISLSGETDT